MKTASEFLGPEPLTGIQGRRGRHWLWHIDGDQLWLVLDNQGASVNTLDSEVLSELSGLLDEADKGVWEAIVFRSAKRSGFAAGADLQEFVGITSPLEVHARVKEANAVVDRIAAMPCMTVAVIHGTCLGGGLELALACDRIIAVDDAGLGFPEVLVGLHPGLGGSARLTHRIHPVEAMKLMLTGKTVNARKAKALGIVDAVVPERNVAKAVRLAASGEMPRYSAGKTAEALNLYPARRAIANTMRAETQKRAPEKHYPAPHALIDLWVNHGGSMEDMLREERASFARLLPSPPAQNLIRDFFLRERLKANGKGPSDIAHVHVVGAGTMGADIGAWCALRGLLVTIEDPNLASLSKAVASAHKLFDRKLRGPEQLRARDSFVPDTHGTGVRTADLIIEAAPEKPALKQSIYKRIESEAKDTAILATNTSSLDLGMLSEGLARPERFVGIHFFNPVAQLELVEVVRHAKVSPEVLETSLRFVADIARLPLPVTPSPGFLVNRALAPYIGEAFLLIDEGVQPERIDEAAENFGMPMGPVTLADQVGLDICLAVADTLTAGLDQPMPPVPQWLRDKVARGELGRKTGKGLYDYVDGKPVKNAVEQPADEMLVDRLVLPLLNAVASALDEGVVADADSADAAMIFGTGFAPFRGGPIHYARERGFAQVAAALEGLAETLGERFRPSAWWRRAGN
ncbi:MAG: enoyl-CoA hydratase/isomerase family protein [Novosphingobium sp.]|nr:enoyl-CoA hydratase/isomerase family protein [Novosphingobium sp.]